MPTHDVHCHFFSPRFFETLGAQAGLQGPERAADAVAARLEWEPPGSVTRLADRWCAELDRHQVGRAVLIASVPEDEASVLDAVARHPNRFVGFGMVDPTRAASLVRAAAACEAGGLRGLCLFPAMFHHRLDDMAVRRVFEVAARCPGTAVFAHCGVLSVGVRARLGLGSPFDLRLGNPLDLLPIAREFAAVPVIVPHFGAGFFREALMLADACPNVRFDTSSSNAWIKYHPGLTLIDAFRRALAVLGSGRLLFGTDSSFFPRGWNRSVHEVQQAVLDEIGVEPADRTRIMADNFEALFPKQPPGLQGGA